MSDISLLPPLMLETIKSQNMNYPEDAANPSLLLDCYLSDYLLSSLARAHMLAARGTLQGEDFWVGLLKLLRRRGVPKWPILLRHIEQTMGIARNLNSGAKAKTLAALKSALGANDRDDSSLHLLESVLLGISADKSPFASFLCRTTWEHDPPSVIFSLEYLLPPPNKDHVIHCIYGRSEASIRLQTLAQKLAPTYRAAHSQPPGSLIDSIVRSLSVFARMLREYRMTPFLEVPVASLYTVDIQAQLSEFLCPKATGIVSAYLAEVATAMICSYYPLRPSYVEADEETVHFSRVGNRLEHFIPAYTMRIALGSLSRKGAAQKRIPFRPYQTLHELQAMVLKLGGRKLDFSSSVGGGHLAVTDDYIWLFTSLCKPLRVLEVPESLYEFSNLLVKVCR